MKATTHDLQIIWRLIEEYAPLIDSRFINIINLLTPYISDIAEMDSTGQTFRYPSSSESRVHLDETPIINIEILKIRFTNLVELLKLLEYTSRGIIYEYSWSNITNKLSRFDIIKATYHMANYLDFDTPYYKAAKASTLKIFNISSNEYSKLVTISTKDKTINHILNIENQPKYLDLNSLETFFDNLDKAYPMTTYVEKHNSASTRPMFTTNMPSGEEYMNSMRVKKETIKDIYDKLSLNQIAEIYALYEFHKQSCYIEIFDCELRENIDELTKYYKQTATNEIYEFIKTLF